MTAVIFFAKARGREFERYEKGLRSNGVVFQKTSPMLRVWSELQTLGGGYTVGGTSDEFLVRLLSVDLKDNDGKDAGCLFVVEKPEGRDFTCGFVDAICNTKSQPFDKKIVFAHTGDSTIKAAEDHLQKNLKLSGIDCYALSSTDTSRLDVTASEIPVPTALAEIEKLVNRCKKASANSLRPLDAKSTLNNLPFVVCTNREALKEEGVTAPYEFIIETEIKGKKSRGNTRLQGDKLVKAIKNRRASVKNFHGVGFSVGYNQLQDWFAGLFRKYLLLDTTAHGNEGNVSADDPSDVILNDCVKDPKKKEAKLLRQRFLDKDFGESDPLQMYKELLKCIYGERFDAIKAALQDQNNAIAELLKIYTDRELKHNDRDHEAVPHKDRLPRAYGDRAKFVTPTGKLNLLLIDDHVEESPFSELAKNESVPKKFESTICNDDWKLLRDIFNVETLQIDNPRKVVSEIRQKLGPGNLNGFTYDLILVDLCLGPSGDLSGYSAIQLIHMYRPGVPVVVYSRFRDMEHITRALNEGAKWFLIKGEEAKLPRHVLKLLKQPGWHKEWNSVKQSDAAPKFEPEDFFRRDEIDCPDAYQYLTYKVLQRFPGLSIHMTPMGGGISGAMTFRAEKGEKDENGRFLQTPHIVKIDKEHAMRMEYERYTRFIRPYMANESGRVEQPERVINREAAAIVYTFAGKQDDAHVLESMGDMLKEDLMSRSACDFNKYREALDWIFDDILPKIHKVKLNDEHTSYPNALFGEVPQGKWLNNYRARMMPCGRVEIKEKFACQNSAKPEFHWEFHDTAKDPEGENKECLEVYDENKNVVLFAGDRCDFIAKFRRRLTPGMTLRLERDVTKAMTDYREAWIEKLLETEEKNAFDSAVRELLGLGEDKPVCCGDILKEVVSVAEGHKFSDEEKRNLSCVIHGDLNLNNIMLEARKHAPKEADRDVTKTINDVWFIDFARTRRDIVTHDFNVFFTSTLGLLFDKDLLDRYSGHFGKVAKVFEIFVKEAVASKSKDLKAVPDEIADDPRLVLVYRILRRCREAALKCMSPETYLITTALSCLNAMKIYIKKQDIKKAAAYLAAAKVCRDLYMEKKR